MSSTNDQEGMAQMNNTVEVRIDGMIRDLPTERSSWPGIFQVPYFLRKLNEEAFEPTIISIGPYHRQNKHLKAMETHKVRFLKDLLQRREEDSAHTYVEVMKRMLERARNCYSESLDISLEDFLEMMVLDGCFIVELLLKLVDRSWEKDPILSVSQISNNILKDLRLIENQLPFFVLWELFGQMSENPSSYIYVILKMYEGLMPGLRVSEPYNESSMQNVKHLVDLLRINWLPSENLVRKYEQEKEDGGAHKNEVKEEDDKWSFIRSATELREAGIKFKKVEKVEGRSLFDIKFANGKLHIPTVTIDDATETLFRNIIACEQFDDGGSPKYLSEYRKVMDCLINTGKDVQLLCRKGIIDNWLGSDEAVAEFFNKLGSEVILDKSNFFYAKLLNDVNKHYYTPCNKRMASLRHKYCNTPWALISILAAAFLLLLTLLQTTFAIFPRP